MPRHSILLLASLAMAGCTSGEPESIGQLDVALVATGGDGAVYRLPAGSSLVVASGTYVDQFSLDGEVTQVSINVPAGDYNLFLVHPAGYSTTWPLERQRGAVVETVDATLLSAMPIAATVPDGFSVSVTLAFRVADGGSIVFSTGTIDVFLDVDEIVGYGGNVENGALLETTDVTFFPEAPAVLASRLPAVGDDVDATVVGSVPGPWQQRSSTMACAPLVLSAIGAGGNAGFADLLFEAAAGQSELCVNVFGGAIIHLSRFGAPLYPSFVDLGTTFNFETEIAVILPTPAFDGTTVNLAALAGTHNLPAFASQSLVDYSGASAAWYSSALAGTATFRFTPTP